MAIKGRRATPEERLRAVQLLKEGNEAELVARMFGVSRAIVFRWRQKYDAGGPLALETKKPPGPAARLSPTQMSQLYAMVTGCDPRQLQFDFGLWTRKIIRDLIRREFGRGWAIPRRTSRWWRAAVPARRCVHFRTPVTAQLPLTGSVGLSRCDS